MSIDALQLAVQANCDIADARHAGELSLCNYLLQMREFFRWQQGLGFDAQLPREALGRWIAEREAHWERVEAAEWQHLPLPDGTHADPFDVVAVNAAIASSGRVYGAGRAARGAVVFFLAEAHAPPRASPLPVLAAGPELARGLAAPPAVLDTRDEPPTIVLRRDALARWCWQVFESYQLHPRAGSAFDALLQHHALHLDFEAALPAWLDEQSEVLVLHECGERQAGIDLGPDWPAWRASLPTRRGELQARALRDHLADLSVTLPALLDRDAQASLHFWFAQYDGLRRELFPSLPAAYAAWRAGDGGAALRRAARSGHRHFLALARAALAAGSPARAEALICSAEAVAPA